MVNLKRFGYLHGSCLKSWLLVNRDIHMSVVFEGRVTNLTVKCLNPLVQFNPNMPWTHERFTWYMPGPTFLSQDMPGPVLNLTRTFGYKTGACLPLAF